MDRAPDIFAEAGFSLEEVIGPDGRYVLYYRWADGDGAQPSPDTPSAPPLRPDAADV